MTLGELLTEFRDAKKQDALNGGITRETAAQHYANARVLDELAPTMPNPSTRTEFRKGANLQRAVAQLYYRKLARGNRNRP